MLYICFFEFICNFYMFWKIVIKLIFACIIFCFELWKNCKASWRSVTLCFKFTRASQIWSFLFKIYTLNKYRFTALVYLVNIVYFWDIIALIHHRFIISQHLWSWPSHDKLALVFVWNYFLTNQIQKLMFIRTLVIKQILSTY